MPRTRTTPLSWLGRLPVLLLCAAPLAPAQATVADGAGQLRGIVFAADSAPASGVMIEVIGEASQRTSEDGAFAFLLPAGTYRLRLRRPQGTVRALERDIPVLAQETTEVLVRLSADGSATMSVEAGVRAASDATTQAGAGPPQVVNGLIVREDGGGPIAGARIYARGVRGEARSDKAGRFAMSLPGGAQELTVIHGRFATIRLTLEVGGPGADQKLKIALRPAVAQLEDYTVTAPRVEGGTATLLVERRQARAVSDVIGAEAISKAGDSDAAAALKRAPGVTVVGGKYVYVRGLGERYSSTLLNGSTLPSPEPERRVVPLDMFPAGMLDSMVIQKSYTADMPGEFGGGVVQLRTRTYPTEFQAQLSLSAGVRLGTTFEDGLDYQGGSLDWLGFDDGTRALPDNVKRASETSPLLERDQFSERGYTAEELEAFGESMPNIWSAERRTIPPVFGLTATIGDGGRIFGKKAGYIASLSYSNDWLGRDANLRILTVGEDQRLETAHDYDFEIYEYAVTLGGILDFGIDLDTAHRLRFTSLLTRISGDETRVYQGFNRDVGTDIRVTRLRWLERMLFSQQVRGEHDLMPDDELMLSWRYNFALAARDEPDRREVRFDREPNEPDLWLLSDRPEGNQRLYSELSDWNHDLGADVRLAFDLWGGRCANLKTGVAFTYKTRDVQTRRYKLLSQGPLAGDAGIISRRPEEIFVPEHIGSDGFLFTEITRQTDNYDATQSVWGVFALVDLPLTPTLKLSAGVRLEGALQQVRTFELFNPDFTPVEAELNNIDPLPSAMLSWSFAEDMQLRAGYGRTLSRPDFRELSPATFNDVTGGRQIFGNPELQRATIDNVDLRWEWYPDRGETISLALFYKRFTQPIETVVVVSSQHSITYANARGAHNLGAELELRKNFGFLSRSLEDFYFAGNATLVYSRVELPEDAGIQTSDERPLQGQSPYVLNAQLGYDNVDSGTSAGIFYNVFGPRISEVGALGAPDIFQEPVHQLDFTVRQRLGGTFAIAFKARNLIDPEVRWTQGGEVVETWRKGRELSLSLSANF